MQSTREMRYVALVMLLVGCSSDEVVPPLTGTTHRFALDGIWLPTTNQLTKKFAGQLDGEYGNDNQLGEVITLLASERNVTTHGFDMIAGGAIASTLEIVADDLVDDPTVGVRYLGTASSPYVELRGQLIDGSFRSNPTATSDMTGEAELHLPVFMEADPSLVNVFGMEMVLIPDSAGGFQASIHAAVPGQSEDRPEQTFLEAVHRGFVQMVASDPASHRTVMTLFDANHDGALAFEEVANNSLLASLLYLDVVIHDTPGMSFGFEAHFRPCEAGQCLDDATFDRCFDRVRDGTESDIDCGGSCRGCEAGAACTSAADCETAACEQGRCAPPSCTDGVRDGLESDVDCGGDCTPCAYRQRCYVDRDCTSRQCGRACISAEPLDCLDLDFSARACDQPFIAASRSATSEQRR